MKTNLLTLALFFCLSFVSCQREQLFEGAEKMQLTDRSDLTSNGAMMGTTSFPRPTNYAYLQETGVDGEYIAHYQGGIVYFRGLSVATQNYADGEVAL